MYSFDKGYGQAMLNLIVSQVPALGRIFVVLDPDDTDENNYHVLQDILKPDPDGQIRVFATNAADGTTPLEQAYAAVESNNNDVIVLDANSTHMLSAGLTISKNRVHFIGFDGGGRLVQQGAKIQGPADADEAFLIKNTGVRNSFRNIKMIQASTNAAALTVYQEGGEGTYMENVSITFGVVDNLDGATTYEIVHGGDSCTYKNVQFGQDTLLTSAARSVMLIDQVTASQEFKSNIFVDCTWLVSSSNNGAQAIKMAAAGDILFTNHFIRPSFLASLDSAGGVACTKAVSTANGTVKGTIYISYPMVHGFSDIGVNGTNNDNLYVFSHAPSAADITSAQPTTS